MFHQDATALPQVPSSPPTMIRDLASSLRHGEQGATTVEHGLIIALIALAAITVGAGLSSAVQDKFNQMISSFR
ncbi:Flp family type IVb pilin [Tundrisphaera sp. TA3]|uniref:Flp family type IVb pilin n=1 Tax=Tundrisphaera sp. TA3 TaxID=3435775 RepID=UPI003EBEFBCA